LEVLKLRGYEAAAHRNSMAGGGGNASVKFSKVRDLVILIKNINRYHKNRINMI